MSANEMLANALRLALLGLFVSGSSTTGTLAAVQRVRISLLPQWLRPAERQALANVFSGARPVHTYSISYPRKFAAILAFNRVVTCGTCAGPSNASIPRGKLIRVSFDRQIHRLNGSDAVLRTPQHEAAARAACGADQPSRLDNPTPPAH